MAHAHIGGHVVMDETANLIPASKVEGTSVYNSDGDSMGSIYDVMLDKRSGQVTYAIMSFGGFLGMGENYHPLPWQKLHYDTGLGGYVVDESADRLKKAPTITRDYARDLGWSRRVNDYYGVPI